MYLFIRKVVMQFIISGQDQTESLGQRVAALGKNLRPIPGRPPELDALSLATANNEAHFLAKYLQQLHYKHQVNTASFAIPRRPGKLGSFFGKLRCYLWRLLRYQHEGMISRQNTVNTLLAEGLALEHNFAQKELAMLREELATMKKALQEAQKKAL